MNARSAGQCCASLRWPGQCPGLPVACVSRCILAVRSDDSRLWLSKGIGYDRARSGTIGHDRARSATRARCCLRVRADRRRGNSRLLSLSHDARLCSLLSSAAGVGAPAAAHDAPQDTRRYASHHVVQFQPWCAVQCRGGRLCSAEYTQNGVTFSDCTTAANPDGVAGKEWCAVEPGLAGSDWAYCAPKIDYGAMRSAAEVGFAAKAEEAHRSIMSGGASQWCRRGGCGERRHGGCSGEVRPAAHAQPPGRDQAIPRGG